MAVPKKRTSKSKKKARKSNWLRKAKGEAQIALSLAKSSLRGGGAHYRASQYILSEPKDVEEEMKEKE